MANLQDSRLSAFSELLDPSRASLARDSRVLIVDDDVGLLRLLKVALEHDGYEVITATDGAEGLAMAMQTQPDLILLDVMMPKISGWTLIRQLRSLQDFAFVPVIFLTALGSEENRIQGFQLGADDYIKKPISTEELSLRILKSIERSARLRTEAYARSRALRTEGKRGFCGTLDEVGLASLLLLLEMECKSGVLRVETTEPPRRADVYLCGGAVVAAQIEGLSLPDQSAVRMVLDWPDGQFQFSQQRVDLEDKVRLSTTRLLLEAAREIETASRRTSMPGDAGETGSAIPAA